MSSIDHNIQYLVRLRDRTINHYSLMIIILGVFAVGWKVDPPYNTIYISTLITCILFVFYSLLTKSMDFASWLITIHLLGVYHPAKYYMNPINQALRYELMIVTSIVLILLNVCIVTHNLNQNQTLPMLVKRQESIIYSIFNIYNFLTSIYNVFSIWRILKIITHMMFIIVVSNMLLVDIPTRVLSNRFAYYEYLLFWFLSIWFLMLI